jgi:hypothetical protein
MMMNKAVPGMRAPSMQFYRLFEPKVRGTNKTVCCVLSFRNIYGKLKIFVTVREKKIEQHRPTT